MYTVYRHISPSGKSYVGITSNSVKQRIQEGYRHNIFLQNAIAKYGWESFQHEVLASGVSRETAECLEIFYIASLELTNRRKGYNIEDGGLAQNFSDYTRAKISEKAKRRRCPRTEETKIKLRSTQAKHCKPFYCIERKKIYMSLRQAATELGLDIAHIQRVLKHRRQTTGGYHFVYLNEITEEVVNAYAKN